MPQKINAIKLLEDDHKVVKELFDQFEKSKEASKKAAIARKSIEELKVHDALEEELFYPAVRAAIGEENIMNEADEEHHMVRIAIAELDSLNDDDERFEAKFTVLSEMVRHHIKEEESDMLPKAQKSGIPMEELGQQMQARKEELKSKGVPRTKEMEMVGAEH